MDARARLREVELRQIERREHAVADRRADEELAVRRQAVERAEVELPYGGRWQPAALTSLAGVVRANPILRALLDDVRS